MSSLNQIALQLQNTEKQTQLLYAFDSHSFFKIIRIHFSKKIQLYYHICFRNHGWNTCPSGHFLRGLYRSGGGNRGLDGIEWGKCCKPAYHPPSYGRCYDKDIKRAFDKKGWVMCEANYFVVGFWRGNGHRLHHIEKMRCCKMVNGKKESLTTRYMYMYRSYIHSLPSESKNIDSQYSF